MDLKALRIRRLNRHIGIFLLTLKAANRKLVALQGVVRTPVGALVDLEVVALLESEDLVDLPRYHVARIVGVHRPSHVGAVDVEGEVVAVGAAGPRAPRHDQVAAGLGYGDPVSLAANEAVALLDLYVVPAPELAVACAARAGELLRCIR